MQGLSASGMKGHRKQVKGNGGGIISEKSRTSAEAETTATPGTGKEAQASDTGVEKKEGFSRLKQERESPFSGRKKPVKKPPFTLNAPKKRQEKCEILDGGVPCGGGGRKRGDSSERGETFEKPHPFRTNRASGGIGRSKGRKRLGRGKRVIASGTRREQGERGGSVFCAAGPFLERLAPGRGGCFTSATGLRGEKRSKSC